MHGASRLTSKKRKRILPDMPQRVETGYVQWQSDCHFCNTAKLGILGVPDPCSVAFADCVSIGEDGQIKALNQAGESLVKKLRLNSAKNIQSRFRWMRTL